MTTAEIALQAGRRLSVDIANLSHRLALLESERELLSQMAQSLTTENWKRSMQNDESTDDAKEVIMIWGEDADVVERIIAILRDVM